MLSNDLTWWVSVVDIPAMAGLFYLIWRTRQESDRHLRNLHNLLETRCSQLREGLSAYKLEVAKTYAPFSEVKEFETRLVHHLIRIETKLDRTALKTERIRGEQENEK